MPLTIQGIQIPDQNSSCSEWIAYHKMLRRDFPKQNANVIFMRTYSLYYSTSWFGSCGNDPAFIDYFDSQGIDLREGAFSNTVRDFNTVKEFIFGIFNTTSETAKFLIPTVIIGATLLTGFFIYRAISSGDANKIVIAGLTRGVVK